MAPAAIHSGEAALNVLIAGNTFYNLAGLNVGIRFDSDAGNLRVINNIWAGCRANQIMLDGDHHHNAFFDNLRVDGASPVSLDDPFCDVDLDSIPRAADGHWDRGAFEYPE